VKFDEGVLNWGLGKRKYNAEAPFAWAAQGKLRFAEKKQRRVGAGCFEGTGMSCGGDSTVRVKIQGKTDLRCWAAPGSWVDFFR
jgi:hypothetical protein